LTLQDPCRRLLALAEVAGSVISPSRSFAIASDRSMVSLILKSPMYFT
jgi:hypothetical protein